MASDMDAKLREIAGIGDMDSDFVRWAGALAAAQKWEKLMKYLAGLASEGAETGYGTEPLEDPFGGAKCRARLHDLATPWLHEPRKQKGQPRRIGLSA